MHNDMIELISLSIHKILCIRLAALMTQLRIRKIKDTLQTLILKIQNQERILEANKTRIKSPKVSQDITSILTMYELLQETFKAPT